MAPEVNQYRSKYGHPSDVYGFALMVLFEVWEVGFWDNWKRVSAVCLQKFQMVFEQMSPLIR